MRILVATISLLGVLVFGSAWIASWVSPTFVESMGREIVRIEVQRQVDEKLDSLDDSRIGQLAVRASGRNTAQIEDIKRQFAQGIPQKIDALIAKMLDPNCTCQELQHFATGVYKDHWSFLARMNQRLESLVQTKYMETTAKLTREFRIFTGANALVFALLGLTVPLRKRANYQLILPTVVPSSARRGDDRRRSVRVRTGLAAHGRVRRLRRLRLLRIPRHRDRLPRGHRIQPRAGHDGPDECGAERRGRGGCVALLRQRQKKTMDEREGAGLEEGALTPSMDVE